MKNTIWKYELSPSITGNHSFKMPKDAEILSVQMQNNVPCIWALVNPESSLEKRYFEIFGTGQDIHFDMGVDRKFIGTFQMNLGILVFHLFERIN